jgi:hypothetical protein
LYGALGGAKGIGDFHVAQAEETSHEQLGPHEIRQLTQTLFQRASPCHSIGIHCWVRQPEEPIQYVDIVDRARATEAPQLIEAPMVGDAAQPAPHTAAAREPLESLKRLEKYLLTDILGELAVAEDPEGKCGEGSAVRNHQDLQRFIAPAAV